MTTRILIYDTETTGLPKNYKPAEEDLTNYPNVVQFAAKVIEVDLDDIEHNKVIYNFDSLVYPFRKEQPLVISDGAKAIHNITENDCIQSGTAIEHLAYQFQGLLNSVDVVVCHNLGFDRNVMVSELLNLGIKPNTRRTTKQFCTMKYSTELLKLPSNYTGKYKFPKLEELFKWLTDKDMNDYFKAHDAAGDVDATATCLLLLLQKDEQLLKWFKGEIENIY